MNSDIIFYDESNVGHSFCLDLTVRELWELLGRINGVKNRFHSEIFFMEQEQHTSAVDSCLHTGNWELSSSIFFPLSLLFPPFVPYTITNSSLWRFFWHMAIYSYEHVQPEPEIRAAGYPVCWRGLKEKNCRSNTILILFVTGQFAGERYTKPFKLC